MKKREKMEQEQLKFETNNASPAGCLQPSPEKQSRPSIFELERELEELRKNNGGNIPKHLDGKINDKQRELYRARVEVKEFALELEKTNDRYLIFVASGHGMYKMIGHSAVFFDQRISKQIKEQSNHIFDDDHYAKSPHGVVTKVLRPAMIDEMERVGIKRTDEIKNDFPKGDLVVFRLKVIYGQEEIEHMIDQLELLESQFDARTLVKHVNPDLYLILVEIQDRAYNLCNRLKDTQRTLLGIEMAKLSSDMLKTYLDASNGRIERKAGLLALKNQIGQIKNTVRCLKELQIVKDKKGVFRLGNSIYAAERNVAVLLRKEKHLEAKAKKLADEDANV